MADPKNLDPAVMAGFTGSEIWFRHGIVRAVTFTEGVHYVAETAGAYWLVDEIAIGAKGERRLAGQEFQVWKLAVANDRGVLTAEDGNGRKLFEKAIAFTDFPEPGIVLWFTDNVILLPSEY
jgi:hypothetical protein